MDNEVVMSRLAFAKYLIQKGDNESNNSEIFSSTAILNYHDALEFLFDLILEDNGLNGSDYSFMKCFDKIDEILISESHDSISNFKASLEKLKNRRVNLKHKGLFPSKNDLLESKITTNNIFKELCERYYDLNYDEITLINLVNNEKVREYLNKANEKYPDNHSDSVKNLSLAFEFLIKDYEDSKKNRFGKSPFKYINKSRLKEFKKINSKDPLKEHIKDSNNTLNKLKKYIKFKLLIPEPVLYIGSEEPEVHLNENETINEFDFQFCLNYVIECAVKLQDFDFELNEEPYL